MSGRAQTNRHTPACRADKIDGWRRAHDAYYHSDNNPIRRTPPSRVIVRIVRILRIGIQKRKTPICWKPWPTFAGDSTSRPLKSRKHCHRKTSTTGARARSAAIPWPHSPTHWCSGGKGIKASAPPTTPSRSPASTAVRPGCGSPARFWIAPGAGTGQPTSRYRAPASSTAATASISSASTIPTLGTARKASRKPSPECGTRTDAIANAFCQGHGKPTTTNQGPQGLKHQGEFSKSVSRRH